MVVRQSDWFLVGLPVDPTPGDAFGIRALGQKYADIALIAGEASSGVRNARSSGSASAWVGDAAEVFRDRSSRMPGELLKANDSYQTVADALRAWAESVDDTQAQADRGLQQAREAAADRTRAMAALGQAELSWTTVHAQQLTYQTLQKAYSIVPPPPGVTMPTDYQLRSVARNAQHAQASIAAAQHAVADADARLAAARRLVLDAKAARDDAERRTVHQIHEAQGQAVKPSSVWEAIQDSAAWQAIVVIATVVLTIVSIVAIFVGGPLVWALIIAATVLLMVDALMSIAQGKDAWGELIMLGIGLIPGGRLIGLAAKGVDAVSRLGSAGARFGDVVGQVGGAVTSVVSKAGAVIDRMAQTVKGAAGGVVRVVRSLTSDVKWSIAMHGEAARSAQSAVEHIAAGGPGGPIGDILKGWDPLGGYGSVRELIENCTKNGMGKEWDWSPMPQHGNIGDIVPMELRPATAANPADVLDRFGGEGGGFLSPAGTPYPDRALPPSNVHFDEPGLNYHRYEVLKPFEMNGSINHAGWGQPGGGLQFEVEPGLLGGVKEADKVAWLIENGFIKELLHW